ncbi:50S ribosomal protein L31e [Candidatus Woesearchaeota archaeon]|nr:50S ribosomal protein L31e [Candidatus Woesearchaeota archaeon]MBW3021896.1 50S ribosomal protein L31e [Candidatus Woesearchaeota archaeon]
MADRTYNVPLRKEWLKTPKYRRSKKAMIALKEFLARHMKVEIKNVKIGKHANLKIWERGIRNPPHHIKVNVSKDDEGIVKAEIVGAPVEKQPEKKEKHKKEMTEREKKKEEIKKKLEGLKKQKKEEPKETKEEKKPEPVKETPEQAPKE